ncbi:hypothetical protein [Luteococcus peritonei]|uniref:Lipoprotein n=1 Tax=Luteococcus peritonei TaxID=88874 RepID=A0ABW4RXD9_9ACTN
MKHIHTAAVVAASIALTGCASVRSEPAPAPSPSVSCTTLDLASADVAGSREQATECFQYLAHRDPERARSVMELVEVPAEDEFGHRTASPTDEHAAQAAVLRIEQGLRADAKAMPVTYERSSMAQQILREA